MRILLLTFLISLTSHGQELTLDDFLSEVSEKNQTVNASKVSSQAANKKKSEKKLLFTPTLFAQAQTTADKKPTAVVSFNGDRTDHEMVSTGFMQQFDFGLKGKLSYTLSHIKIRNAVALPLRDYNETAFGLELSQSLWRNFLGSESKAQAELIERQNLIQKHSENFKVITILAKAEALYWSLSQIKKIVAVQKESLDRANKIRSWTENRLKNGLGEKSDFLQADANYKFREYELQSSIQDHKTLQRAFNSLRGKDEDSVVETLEPVNPQYLKKLVLPKRDDIREDTKVAREIHKLTRANAELSVERNKPTLELYGTYILNGRDAVRSTSIDNAFTKDYATQAIGVRFNTPIDFINLKNNIDGYRKDQIAAELNFKQKVFDESQEWADLTAKLEDAKTKLQFAEKIEEAQRIKALNERERLAKGRTVTFQVLNFEQDYAQSELLKIKTETDLLNIYSQLKIFSSGDKQ